MGLLRADFEYEEGVKDIQLISEQLVLNMIQLADGSTKGTTMLCPKARMAWRVRVGAKTAWAAEGFSNSRGLTIKIISWRITG